MRIGIDISQIAFEGTGVGNYVRRMVAELLRYDKKNEYILFGASLRKRQAFFQFFHDIYHSPKQVRLVVVPIPPTVLEFLWNKLHVVPIEWFTGSVDVFWSSDWTQPPLGKGVRGITTIHDVSFLHYPESFDKTIISVQNHRLKWAKRECQHFLCDSEATKRDAEKLLHIDPSRLSVIYPGYSSALNT